MYAKHKIKFYALLFMPLTAHAEEIFYGNRSVPTEIRADTSTLVLLAAVPLSVSCQPVNKVQVQALERDSLTSIEAGHVTVSKSAAEEENPMLKRMLRIIPAPNFKDTGDTTDCVFNLANGQQVGAKFILKLDITRPFIEFKPLSSRNANLSDPAKNLALEGIKASVGGTPLQSIREDRPFLGYKSAAREKGKYRITYRGGNGSNITLWVIEGVVKPAHVTYDELAILNPSPGSIFYSTLMPEQSEFQDGDHFILHVVGSNALTEEEVLKALN